MQKLFLKLKLIKNDANSLAMYMRRLIIFIAIFIIVFPLPAKTKEDNTIETAYQNAAVCFREAQRLKDSTAARAKWYKCSVEFDQYYLKYPKSPLAPNALYSAAISYKNIYNITRNRLDAKEAIDRFSKLAKVYRKSTLADDALLNTALLTKEALENVDEAKALLKEVLEWYPGGDMEDKAREYLSKWSSKGEELPETRKVSRLVKLINIERREKGKEEDIILTLSAPTGYNYSYGKYELSNHKLFSVELNNTFISRVLKTPDYSFIGESVVRDIMLSQKKRDQAEIGVVLTENATCSLNSSNNIINIHCGISKKGAEKNDKERKKKIDIPASNAPAALEPLQTKQGETKKEKNVVILIDPGHGGKDTGAIGPRGTMEKDITLELAKRIGWHLRNKFGHHVEYTRINDKYLSLDDRINIAKGFTPDILVSIHANASKNSEVSGYQTFYLNNATDEASKRLARIENSAAGKNLDELDKIILAMMQNINTDESRVLASFVHKAVLSGMSMYGLKDLGIKTALFYVLVGTKCPSILIETSFISNPIEEERLKDSDYQDRLASSIAKGIQDYIEKHLSNTKEDV